jgi:cytochrome b
MSTNTRLQNVRIWDLPTRLFHGLLLALIAGMYVTGNIGGEWMRLHFLLGYAVLCLILFRLIWGFFGGYWSRFSHFVPTPNGLIKYVNALRHHKTQHAIGHNPLGALSVLALLFSLLLQVFSGFCSDDEITATGPWTSLVSSNWVEWATFFHTEIGQVLLLCLIGLHVSSVVFYKWVKREDLITPMIKGDKTLPLDTQASKDTAMTRFFALIVLSACGYVVYVLVQLV